ncbi:MAG: hypothetical protein HY744_00290, partial [Deltaproteobacteria bacterium]|nr:hypothetical protein [Deltaproteobacteria bacterium]
MLSPIRPSLCGAALLALSLAVVAAAGSAQPAGAGPAGSTAAADQAVLAAQRHFAAGRYGEGRTVLLDACVKVRGSHAGYARLLMALAVFYERDVGDPRFARGYVREIRSLKLAPDNPDLLGAARMDARLGALAVEYGPQDALLARMARPESGRDALQERVAELTALVERRPDYPRLAAAFHFLGESHLGLDDYPAAYRACAKALALRPAI